MLGPVTLSGLKREAGILRAYLGLGAKQNMVESKIRYPLDE